MAARDDNSSSDEEFFTTRDARDEYVLDELDGFPNESPDVVYRRAPQVSTPFVATPFDALEAELFHPMEAKSEMSPFGKMEGKTKAAGPETSQVQGSPYLEPTGTPPRAAAVGYFEVNPQFTCPSGARAEVIFRTLRQAIQSHVEEYQCFPDWSIQAIALVNAEEVQFNVQLYTVSDDTIRVDFTLRSGDEPPFLEVADKIRKDCRSIDQEMLELPDLSFDLFDTWSSGEALFPGSLKTSEDDLRDVLEDIRSPQAHPVTVYESAKLLKNYCQDATNRNVLRTKLYREFLDTLQHMLQGDDDDVSRFGIFALLLFAQDPMGLEVHTLEDAMTRSFQKGTTRKLASELQSTISGSCIRKKLTA